MIAFNTFLVTLGGTAAIAAGVFILLVVTETVPPEVLPGGVFDLELGAMADETGAALWTFAGIALALIAAGMAVLALGVPAFDPRRYSRHVDTQFGGRGHGAALSGKRKRTG